VALLAPQIVPVTGLEATYTSASDGGDTIAPDNGLVLHVRNADASDKTVTVVRPGAQYGQANPDVAVVVTAGENRFIKIPRELADTDGLIDVTYSAVTSVTVALLRVS
jgi:hypothetical protein